MFDASDVNAFAAEVSAARFAAFPCAFSYLGLTLTGTCTSLKTRSQLGEGGFTFSHDAYARISLALLANPPAVGDPITVFLPGGPAAGQPMRIVEVQTHSINPEYRLGLDRL